LSLIFHRDGVPNLMVMDGAKAQVERESRIKLCDAVFHIKQTEPHTQSSNMDEVSVSELKKGVGRQGDKCYDLDVPNDCGMTA
jgi:hypothetical protein